MILLQTFTTGFELDWILRPCWWEHVPMIVFAIVIKRVTGVDWRVVVLKALIRILRNPKGIQNIIQRHRDRQLIKV